MTESTDEIEIDLGRLFRRVAGRWMTVMLSAVLCAAAMLGTSCFLLAPRYESGVKFYVYNTTLPEGASMLSSGDLTTARKLVESCIVILDTRESQSEIISHAGANRTCRELEKMITAEAVGETEFFEVTVSSRDPVEAEKIADAIAAVLPGRISAIIDGVSVKVADAAVLPSGASSPNHLYSALTGFLLGALLSVTAIVVRELLTGNSRERTHEKTEKTGRP